MTSATWYQEQKSKYFCPLPPGIRVTEENTIVKHWIERHFTYVKKRQSKISSNSVHSFHKSSKSLPRNPNNSHKPFCAAVEEPQLLPTEYETLKLAA